MRTWGWVLAMCFVIVGVGTSASPQGSQPSDRYLDRYRGPYRGSVVDADTGAPLAGAVVVAAWSRDRIYPLHSVNEPYAVMEAMTDADGRFSIEAKELEEHAPRRTLRPEFLIFLPGYGSFPGFQRAPSGFLGDVFEGIGTTIKLARLGDHLERRSHLRAISPHSFTEKPFKDLPQLMGRINEERRTLGLSPLSPVE